MIPWTISAVLDNNTSPAVGTAMYRAWKNYLFIRHGCDMFDLKNSYGTWFHSNLIQILCDDTTHIQNNHREIFNSWNISSFRHDDCPCLCFRLLNFWRHWVSKFEASRWDFHSFKGSSFGMRSVMKMVFPIDIADIADISFWFQEHDRSIMDNDKSTQNTSRCIPTYVHLLTSICCS